MLEYKDLSNGVLTLSRGVPGEIHLMRPHVEKKCAKTLKIGRVIAIFCSPYKNSETSHQKSRKGVFRSFLIDTKFSNQAKILWVFYNGIFRFHILYQPIDTPDFFFRVLKFFRGAKREVPPKNIDFLLLLSHDNRLTLQPIYSLI